ncbi:hypothetical protein L210DRAFT_3554043 [Boletus edulis BED1]|uniref:Uncharacterized protein n=1 Tax=Boletus edulis BED1 TaxID=1328754 RepID=A0AAD4GB42_BOLED|nr:hypothetical protein L210DRAFT_3554043 [Boletus edulis BED1]
MISRQTLLSIGDPADTPTNGLNRAVWGHRFAVRYVFRTRGIREPEQRLWLTVASLLLCPAPLGVGASKGISWSGLLIGMGIIPCPTCIGSFLSIGYKLLSYKDLSGELMMAVILVLVCVPTHLEHHIDALLQNNRHSQYLTFSDQSHFSSNDLGGLQEQCGPY